MSGTRPGAAAILRAWHAADAPGASVGANAARPRIRRRIDRPGPTALATLACAAAGAALLWAAADFPGNGPPESRRRGLMGFPRDPSMKYIQAASAPKFLSATLVAAAVLAPDAVAQNPAKQWRVQDGGNGHWYAARRWDFPKTWPEARDAAVARGGYLACVTSAAESQWLGANMTLEQPGCGLGRMGWYLGGYQDRNAADHAEPAGGWRWVSGEPWDYTAWLTNANYPGLQGGDRPNNFGGDEQYLKMSESPYAPWWDDVGTTSDQQDLCGAIIEWSADCNNDGIVDYGQCRDGSLADYDGNNVPDCCERGEACSPAPGTHAVQWRTEEGGNGHWFAVMVRTEGITWNFASSSAVSMGGHLATITSAAELGFIITTASATSNLDPTWFGPWLGGFQPEGSAEPAGNWRWITGDPWSFTAWGGGGYQPDNGCGGNEDYLHHDNFGAWNDARQDGRCNALGPIVRAVIEWSADCDSDGQVDIGQILRGEALDGNANGVPDHCEITCADVDLYANGEINGADLGIMLSEWGPAVPGSASDIDGDGQVNGVDLAFLLAFWGPCGG